MKLFAPSLGLLALVVSVNAQYFSDGWSPGQAQTTQEAPPPAVTSAPQKQADTFSERLSPSKILSYFDFNKVLASPPSIALFSRLGINVTERLEAAFPTKFWDERVTLITDDNYNDLIVNELLTEQEEQDRTWILIMCVPNIVLSLPLKYLLIFYKVP